MDVCVGIKPMESGLWKSTYSKNKTAEYDMTGYDFACNSSEYSMIHISTQNTLQTQPCDVFLSMNTCVMIRPEHLLFP